jgi:hypothetical protein
MQRGRRSVNAYTIIDQKQLKGGNVIVLPSEVDKLRIDTRKVIKGVRLNKDTDNPIQKNIARRVVNGEKPTVRSI